MNKLELVQELARLAGISDSGGPATLVGQTGDNQKAIRYIDAAHEEIQNEYADWNFLWASASFDTTIDVALYAGASGLLTWDVKRIYCDGELIDVIPYQDYTPEALSSAKPMQATILPNGQIKLIPVPDAVYPITYDYFRAPKVMSSNTDEPLIPLQYHIAIVARALIMYANFESASEAKVQGEELYTKYMTQLKNNQLPRRKQTFARSESIDLTVIPE